MTTVVLGWDGLDSELAEAFDLAAAFGEHHRRLETFDNPVLGKPHTAELWPSIVTGVTPDEHGVRAAVEGEGVSWGNPAIATAARLAQYCVPETVRTRIGEALRSRGAGLDVKTAAWYRENGIETVFDGRRSRAITVPNYAVERDERLDLVADRGADLAAFLETGGDGDAIRSPTVSVPELEERLVGEATKKLGVVRACAQREYDLIFAWLGYLDTIGHLAPVVEEGGWQERSYRLAASLTADVADALAEDDALVCVSDHGLRDGYHTHDAFVGSDDPDAVSGVESVLDVRAGIDRVTPRSGTDDEPDVREPFRRESAVSERTADDVRGQLEDLGYL